MKMQNLQDNKGGILKQAKTHWKTQSTSMRYLELGAPLTHELLHPVHFDVLLLEAYLLSFDITLGWQQVLEFSTITQP